MGNRKASSHTAARLPVFAISCWLLGLMGFSQVLIAGMALSAKFDTSRGDKIVYRDVPKFVPLPVESKQTPVDIYQPPPLPPPIGTQALPEAGPVPVPQVADPRSEHLLKEAQKARVAGDNMKAILKLEEALTQSPEDPSIHYELGLVHEQMGVFDKAGAYYEKVFKMGVGTAGKLYQSAANKLRDGFVEETKLGKLALGRVRIFNDPEHEGGKRVILSVPVQKAPGEEIEIGEMELKVTFFNRNKRGEISQLPDENKSWVTDKWDASPSDWAGGEETVQMTYIIPRHQDTQIEHLFGDQSYYGQVVSLVYKGEVLDVQAWPRDLAARMPGSVNSGAAPLAPEFQGTLPEGFDPNLPLLPPINNN